MKKILMLSVMVLLTTLIAGCSNNPDKKELSNQVKTVLLADGGSNLFEVSKIEVINSREMSETEYLAKLAYTLKFKVGLADLVKELKQSSSGLDAMDGMMFLSMLEEMYGPFKAGETKQIQEEYLFVKTEKGWQLFTEG